MVTLAKNAQSNLQLSRFIMSSAEVVVAIKDMALGNWLTSSLHLSNMLSE